MSQIFTAFAFLAATLAFGSNARSPGSWEQISQRLGTGWENFVQRILPENDGFSAKKREHAREKEREFAKDEEGRPIMEKNSYFPESTSRSRSDTTSAAAEAVLQSLTDTITQAISRPAPHLASSDPNGWKDFLRLAYPSNSRSGFIGGSTLVGEGSRSGSIYPEDEGDSRYASTQVSPTQRGVGNTIDRAWGEDFLRPEKKGRPIREDVLTERRSSSRGMWDPDGDPLNRGREPENKSYLDGEYHGKEPSRRSERPDMYEAMKKQRDPPRDRDERSGSKSGTRAMEEDPRSYRNDRDYEGYNRRDRQKGDPSRGGRGRGMEEEDEDRYGESRYREKGRERERGRSRRRGYEDRYEEDRYEGRSGGRSRRDYGDDDDYRETGRYRDEKSRRRDRKEYNERQRLDNHPYDDEGNPIHSEHGRRGPNGEILAAAVPAAAAVLGPPQPVIVNNNVIGGIPGFTAPQPAAEPVSRDSPKVEEPRASEPQKMDSAEQAEVAPDPTETAQDKARRRGANFANAGTEFSDRKRKASKGQSDNPTPIGELASASGVNGAADDEQSAKPDVSPRAPSVNGGPAQEGLAEEDRRGRTRSPRAPLPSDSSGSEPNPTQTERPRSLSGRREQLRLSVDTLADAKLQPSGSQSPKERIQEQAPQSPATVSATQDTTTAKEGSDIPGGRPSGSVRRDSVTSPIGSVDKRDGAKATRDELLGSPVSPLACPSKTRDGPRHTTTTTKNPLETVEGMAAELAFATDAESSPVRRDSSTFKDKADLTNASVALREPESSADSESISGSKEARSKRKRRLAAKRGEKEIRDISRNVIQGQSSVLKRHGVTGPKSFGRLVKLAFKSSPKMAFLSAVVAGIYAIGVVYIGNQVAKMGQTTALASQLVRRQSLGSSTSTSVPADPTSTSTSSATFDSFERDTQILILLCIWHAVCDLILLLLTHHIWNDIPDPDGERSYKNWLDRLGLLSVLRILVITAPMGVYLLLGARQLTSCAYLLNHPDALVWSIGPDVGLSWDYLAGSLDPVPNATSGDAIMPDMPDTEGLQLLGLSAFFWFTGLPVFLYSIKRVLHPGSPSRLKIVKRIKRGHSGVASV